MRRPIRPRRPARGFALIAILTLLIAGALAFLVAIFGPEAMEAYRRHKTEAALAEAREALLGYATTYRDNIDPNSVYGYLLLPDLGYSANLASDDNRNNNIGCQHEGCDAGFAVRPAGSVAGNFTVIGRFPWYLVGTEPIRDGYGECLWYAVSGSHKRTQPVTPMNWDTLGQMDVVVANGNPNLASILASAHDRPVAVIFSPGPPLPGQDRAPSANQVVDACGGNYDVANYLDPVAAAALPAVTNFFGGSTNNASADTRDETRTLPAGPNDKTKSLSTQGAVYKRADDTLWANACPSGADCTLSGNDKGLALTPDALFGAIRRSSGFRSDVNSMLDRMVGCLRDYAIAGGGSPPVAIPGYAPPGDKSAGRAPDIGCYSAAPPLGYFTNWQDMLFVAGPNVGTFNVTVDGIAQACRGVLIFAGQRGAGQSRTDLAAQSTLSNYLEGINLASFTAPGIDFAGPGQLDIVSAAQSAQQDIVRCIPTTTSLTEVESPALTADQQLVNYDPGTRTLTLGKEGVESDSEHDPPSANSLFGCAWTPELDTRGKGFRTYFQFQFKRLGGSVGSNGFVFAAVDGERNGTNVCGAAGSHLGYSGDNRETLGLLGTPPIAAPKIGIEFDQSYNAGFSESSDLAVSNPGRNDPCGTDCGGEYNSHSAIVYWGHEVANTTDGVTRPNDDDNVHGYPTATAQVGNPRPVPRNPGGLPGLAFVNLRGQSSLGGDSFLYHIRVEVTPVRSVNTSAAESSNTAFTTRVWISHANSSDPLAVAMANTTRPMAQLYPTATPTMADTATVYDVAGSACGTGGTCPAGQACGTDNVCYRPGLKSVRLGFTGSQRTQDQQVLISNFFTSWLQ